MAKPTVVGRTIFAALLLILTLALSACSALALPGELGHLQAVTAACPANGDKLAIFDPQDFSGSSSSTEITDERLAVIRDLVTQGVLCGGAIDVLGFSTSSGSNAPIYDADLPALPGQTVIARVREAGPIIDAVMKKITAAYRPAMKKVPTTATDIIGEYRLATEYARSLGSGYQLRFATLTDGFNNVTVNPGDAALSSAAAEALAKTVTLPVFPRGSSIIVAGVGNVSGTPAPSDVVAGLVTFYTDLCAQASVPANRCEVATSLPAGWWSK